MKVGLVFCLIFFPICLHSQTKDFTLDLNISTKSMDIIDEYKLEVSHSDRAYVRGVDIMWGIG